MHIWNYIAIGHQKIHVLGKSDKLKKKKTYSLYHHIIQGTDSG